MKTKRGFTLIEILIGLTIISTFFSFGYSNYQDYARRQQAISSSREIESAINLTKQLALAGTKPDVCKVTIPEYDLNGYRIIFDAEDNTYSIVAVCNDIDYSIGKDDMAIAQNLDLQLADTNTNSAILFKVIGEGTDIDDENFGISIVRTDVGSFAEIEVSKSGDITTSVSTVFTTPTPAPTATPSSPPTSGCGSTCRNDNECSGQLTCSSKKCVNPSCPIDADCVC